MVEKGKALRQGKKRRMTKFAIDEISAVDFPAQEPARAVITKRKDLGAGAAGEDHSALLESFMALDTAQRNGAVIALAKALQIEFTEDGRVVDLIEKAGDEPAVTGGNTMPDQTPEEVIAGLQKDLERLTKVAELDDAQRAHFVSLGDDASEQFLASSAEDRAVEVNKATAEDPIVYTDTDGSEYRKSDDSRIVALAKKADKAVQAAATAEALRRNSEFAKRAEDELSNLPGDTGHKALLIKAIEGIEDEDARKAISEMLTAANTANADVLVQRGVGDARVQPGTDAVKQLDELAKVYQKENAVSYSDAYAKIGEDNPDLLEQAITNSN